MDDLTKVEITDYVNVVETAKNLGVRIPSQLALLPRNFHSVSSKHDLIHESETSTVRILFRKENIEETPIESPNEKIPEYAEKSFGEWIAPIIFFSFSILTKNPTLINLAIGVISNYLTDLFKGLSAERKAKLEVVVENKKGLYKKITYEGPLDGLKTLPKIIKEVGLDE